MTGAAAPARWADAQLAAALFAVDPAGLGGVALRAGHGAVRDRWLAGWRAQLPAGQAPRTMPAGIGDERLLGGLDLTATLRLGRPVAQPGLLAEVDGGVLLLAMAERLTPTTVARLCAALDTGSVLLAREGLLQSCPSRFGVVALDEGIADDEQLAAPLADRLAFHVDLGDLGWRDAAADGPALDLVAARQCLAAVQADDEQLVALCHAAAALGIASSRAPLLALRAARAAAALAGRSRVSEADVAAAARLVLAPRATRLPPAPAGDDAPAEPPPVTEPAPPDATEPPPADPADRDEAKDDSDSPPAPPLELPEDLVIAAARAALSPGLLARLQAGGLNAARASSTAGRSGAVQRGGARGRPAGVQRGELRGGARLNLVETLRAAAPWQAARRASTSDTRRVVVWPQDFRVTRHQQRSTTTTVFAIDASGSSALNRLAEAKGAVELLLADCYVRRDRVAVLAFRGQRCELLLPPTRSLARAKRSLAGLPGGGGTPLATAMDAAYALADSLRRRGDTPLVVLLTDARANVARDGSADRARAQADALLAAGPWRLASWKALLVDTSPRPEPRARELAERMHATYVALPYAQAAALSQAVRVAADTVA